MIQFDQHIFPMGWFNHQLDTLFFFFFFFLGLVLFLFQLDLQTSTGMDLELQPTDPYGDVLNLCYPKAVFWSFKYSEMEDHGDNWRLQVIWRRSWTIQWVQIISTNPTKSSKELFIYICMGRYGRFTWSQISNHAMVKNSVLSCGCNETEIDTYPLRAFRPPTEPLW